GPKSSGTAKIGSAHKGESTPGGAKPGFASTGLVAQWRDATLDKRLLALGAGALCVALLVAGVWWTLAPVKGTPVDNVKEPEVTVQSLKDQSQVKPSRKASDTLESPEFRDWMKSVVDMPAAAQVSAVVKKLQELNPGFDGQATHRIENAV